jgi:hypothetical protein
MALVDHIAIPQAGEKGSERVAEVVDAGELEQRALHGVLSRHFGSRCILQGATYVFVRG